MVERRTLATAFFVLFVFVISFGQIAKKRGAMTMHRPISVSQLIAQGANEEKVKTAWTQFITYTQPKDYDAVRQLVTQTTQKAYLEGNNDLARAIAKVEYLTTVKVAISNDIQAVHLTQMGQSEEPIHKKTFRTKPSSQDLQKRVLYGHSLDQMKQQRITLIQMAKYSLGQQASLSRSISQKKNQRKAKTPNLYTTREVMSLHSLQFTTKEDLQNYLVNLKKQFIQVEKDYKRAKTELQSSLQRQQQTQHNMHQLGQVLYNAGIELVVIEEEDEDKN